MDVRVEKGAGFEAVNLFFLFLIFPAAVYQPVPDWPTA